MVGSCGRLIVANAAGLLLGFAACDLIMRLRAPLPPVAARAASEASAAASRAGRRARLRKQRLQQPAAPQQLPQQLPPLPRARDAAPSVLAAEWAAVPCESNCSSHGVCNLDTGECACELGYAGSDCEQRDEFSCDLPEGDELVSRCAGSCDDAELKCYCGGGKFPRRPMFQCEFRGVGKWMSWKSEGWNHARVAASPRDFWSSAADAPGYLRKHPVWGQPPDAARRRVAWCDAEPGRGPHPAAGCNCHEGTDGALCETPVLMACLNQCNARGVCHHGFCRCDEGWYGVDCSLHRGSAQPMRVPERPPTQQEGAPPAVAEATAVAAVATATAGEAAWQRRPLIYVYELPPRFNTEMWSTKTEKRDCTLRAYTPANGTRWHMHAFGMEVAVLERLLASHHRTNDPERADYFYVPVWAGCFLSRFSRPTPRHFDLAHLSRAYPLLKVPRPARASQLVRDALEHISERWPYWNRSGGADHIWAFPHDEGACLAPAEIAPSILVTHWGRKERRPRNHTTISAGQGWHLPPWHRRMMGGVAQCYRPGQDVLLPIFKSRQFVMPSPHLTGVRRSRPVLFSFLGNALHQPPSFSFGLRQQLWALHAGRNDSCMPARCAKHNAGCKLDFDKMDKMAPGCTLVGGHTRNFIQVLQRSSFCAVLPGNGWGHIEEPAIHGCIPVIIMPGIDAQLEGVLDMAAFAVRVERHELGGLIERLRAISPAQLEAMRAQLRTVWERFTYSGLFKREYQLQLGADKAARPRLGATALEDKRHFGPLEQRLTGEDAVDALIDVLRRRLRARAEPGVSPLVDHRRDAARLPPLRQYESMDTAGIQ